MPGVQQQLIGDCAPKKKEDLRKTPQGQVLQCPTLILEAEALEGKRGGHFVRVENKGNF